MRKVWGGGGGLNLNTSRVFLGRLKLLTRFAGVEFKCNFSFTVPKIMENQLRHIDTATPQKSQNDQEDLGQKIS